MLHLYPQVSHVVQTGCQSVHSFQWTRVHGLVNKVCASRKLPVEAIITKYLAVSPWSLALFWIEPWYARALSLAPHRSLWLPTAVGLSSDSTGLYYCMVPLCRCTNLWPLRSMEWLPGTNPETKNSSVSQWRKSWPVWLPHSRGCTPKSYFNIIPMTFAWAWMQAQSNIDKIQGSTYSPLCDSKMSPKASRLKFWRLDNLNSGCSVIAECLFKRLFHQRHVATWRTFKRNRSGFLLTLSPCQHICCLGPWVDWIYPH